MQDRLRAAARTRGARPRAILVIYALIALGAVVSFAGQMLGWWRSPIADKIIERRKSDAQKPAPTAPAPTDPSMAPPDGAPDRAK